MARQEIARKVSFHFYVKLGSSFINNISIVVSVKMSCIVHIPINLLYKELYNSLDSIIKQELLDRVSKHHSHS